VSILDSGPHTVTCFPEETVIDSNGSPTKRPSSIGVTVTGCLMMPTSSRRELDPAPVAVRTDAEPLGDLITVAFPPARVRQRVGLEVEDACRTLLPVLGIPRDAPVDDLPGADDRFNARHGAAGPFNSGAPAREWS
jgi:hypothetical protein